MKLHLDTAPGENFFTGYGPGYVAVNHVRYDRHVLVMSDQLATWEITGFDAIGPDHIEHLLALKPEVVLLGTGASLRFPRPELACAFSAAGVGLEVMDTPAACRTYNILVAEGRRVLAAVLVS